MRKFVRFLVRISAFLRKEIVEILRQLRLVVTLVLGPFLILLLFGIGYTAKPIPLRTLFVVPQDSALRPYLQQNANNMIQQLVYEGIVDNEDLALARLRADQVDLVMVVPPDVTQTVRDSQQVTLDFYHNTIDPLRVQYVHSFVGLFVNELNQRILRLFAEQGQQEASNVEPDVKAAQESTKAMREALQQDDPDGAQQQLNKVQGNVNALQAALLAGSLVLSSVDNSGTPGAGQNGSDPLALLQQIQQNLDTLRQQQGLDGTPSPGGGTPGPEGGIASPSGEENSEDTLTQLDQNLAQLQSSLNEFQSIRSSVLVSPFRSDTKSVLPVDIDLVDYYVPSVIAILLQHLCVTFGALSVVRESRMGTMEMFQASPLSAFEVLVGKYLSYSIFILALMAVLSVLLIFVVGVPMLGWWGYFALAIVALVFASLGIGFVISLLSQTMSQAVQYSMLVLLVSVFFTGFFLTLDWLQRYVRLLSWSIPGTYGIQLLQDIMLRGQPANMMWIEVLAGIGLGLFVLAWLLLRRRMMRS
ncbi:MAG: ABC transporter permease [Anaerolineae bacterium]